MRNQVSIKIKKLFNDVTIPEYATSGSAGFDLSVHNFKLLYREGLQKENFDISHKEEIEIMRGDRILCGCGFSLEIPNGYELQVRSRSGNSLKKGLIIANSPGTIDSDYRGEIGVIITNLSNGIMLVKKGDKLGQGVVKEYYNANFIEVNELGYTERGEGGFGSTNS